VFLRATAGSPEESKGEAGRSVPTRDGKGFLNEIKGLWFLRVN